ncbi:hypothetical protein MMC07_001466 [Pseudocyphellaria aurata]|nr:hypothetical protein [Pseudocyphellaria aurata]
MSDDEADGELLALLRESFGLNGKSAPEPPRTKVLENAEFVCNNSIDVALNYRGSKAAASIIWTLVQEKKYSFRTWSEHELHPKAKDASTVDFIFTMDLLNFSFWSDSDNSNESYAVDFRGRIHTGYWSLVATLQRALEEGIPITNPTYWIDDECTDEILRHVFRSVTTDTIPLLDERISCLREAGKILHEVFDGSFINCIDIANGSAAALVNLVVESFPCFKDETRFEGRTVRFYKRAQILVADLWACFEGKDYGDFHDIDTITMFADYRIPQMLHSLGCLQYSPSLEHHIRQLLPIESGHNWEIQLRGCSIWCVELLRREILRQHPESTLNAILIDFFLYDTIKEEQERILAGKKQGQRDLIPHHRTRSIWY